MERRFWDGVLDGDSFFHNGDEFIIVNVYAPSIMSEREALFKILTSVLSRHEGPVILGGDFNCTLNTQLDRSYVVPRRHESPVLRRLLAHTGLVGVLSEEMDRAEDERNSLEFHANTHTYSID